MSHEQIQQIKRELKNIRAEIADLRKLFMAESELIVKHSLGQDRAIGDLFRYVMPLVHKFNPEFAKTMKQFKSIIKRDRPAGDPPPDGKDSG
jgi:hypothetical protein